MSILVKLSKRDKEWRKLAYYFCKDKELADDIVNDMYLKLAHKKELNDFYVISTIKHLYWNIIKKKKMIAVDVSTIYNLQDNESTFEPDDDEKELLDKFEELEWYKQELIKESFDHSYREIEERYNINYGYAYRETQKAIKHILGDDYSKYNNSNLKYKKQKGKHKSKDNE